MAPDDDDLETMPLSALLQARDEAARAGVEAAPREAHSTPSGPRNEDALESTMALDAADLVPVDPPTPRESSRDRAFEVTTVLPGERPKVSDAAFEVTAKVPSVRALDPEAAFAVTLSFEAPPKDPRLEHTQPVSDELLAASLAAPPAPAAPTRGAEAAPRAWVAFVGGEAEAATAKTEARPTADAKLSREAIALRVIAESKRRDAERLTLRAELDAELDALERATEELTESLDDLDLIATADT